MFQTEEARENVRSPSVALLCAGQLRRSMVHETEQVLRVCDGFFLQHVSDKMEQYCCDSGCANKLLCIIFLLLQEANEVILDVWLCSMTLEGARLLELHSYVPVASGMSHHE